MPATRIFSSAEALGMQRARKRWRTPLLPKKEKQAARNSLNLGHLRWGARAGLRAWQLTARPERIALQSSKRTLKQPSPKL
eukprot:8077652-Alexandrium_andersonii.AAC.1